MKIKTKIFLALILLLALCLRVYKLDQIPAGIHADEESHGYNAFSIIKTGLDRYGQRMPILFRSFGSYQPPLYTYLTIGSVALFGNTIFAARLVSALAGVALSLITFLIVRLITEKKYKDKLALVSALVVAISPWSIFFSRHVAEGNLGVMVFTLALLLLLLALSKPKLFPLACLVLGLSTHAYYSERIIGVVFLPIYLFLYRNYYLKDNKKWIIAGLVVFGLTMLPHLAILNSGALTRRLDQVGYIGGKPIIIEFLRRYLIYYSPRNLFFDTGIDLGRMSPEIGVFYVLFVIPFFFGIRYIAKFVSNKYLKIFVVLLLINPIPAALTGDNFYPLRALDHLWIVGLMISVGIVGITEEWVGTKIKWIFGGIFLSLIFSFYISFFILFKYEKASAYGYAYVPLVKYLEKYSSYNIMVDSERDSGIGLRLAYLMKYDPRALQVELKKQMQSPYYSAKVNIDDVYKLGNIQVKQLSWFSPCDPNTLMVGDTLSISDKQAQEHHLKFEFEIKDQAGFTKLRAFSTNPLKENCPR